MKTTSFLSYLCRLNLQCYKILRAKKMKKQVVLAAVMAMLTTTLLITMLALLVVLAMGTTGAGDLTI